MDCNMDGKPKQNRRARCRRDKVRRLGRASASSGSDTERGPPVEDRSPSAARSAAVQPPPLLPPLPPPPACRRRRESGSQEEEEDIIDGFAIVSFPSLDCLEKKNGTLKTQDRKEKWEKKAAKRRREVVNVLAAELPENGLNCHRDDRPRECEPELELDRGKERVKKTYSKKNKQMKSLCPRPLRSSEDETAQELSRPQRSNSRDPLSESSTHSLSGRGYSCDSESDVDDKASDVGSEKLFSPTAGKGITANENHESRICSSAKVSGLQRSQEQSNEATFAPPIPSPAPASTPIGSPVPAATAAPPSKPRLTPHPPLPLKKELAPPALPSALLKVQSQALSELRVPPPQHHVPPVISHQVHHPLQYSSLHSISRGSSGSSIPSIALPKHHRALSPHISSLPPSAPGLPLSFTDLSASHFSLRAPAHRHSAMFATPATLPPPPTLPTNGLVVPGHPAAAGYPGNSLTSTNESSRRKPSQLELEKQGMPEHDLLRQELNNRFLVQSSERSRGPSASPLAPVSLLRAEFHQHQHMHQHQHTHQHTFTPYPAGLPPAAVIAPPTAPPMFDKYAPKLDSPFLRHSNFFPSYPPAMPGMPPLLPHTGPFSSLQGAFQPKASNPLDVAGRPGAVPHTLLQKDPRVTDPFRTSVRKPGKWCAVHVQIAWQIYHHQQKMKQMHMEPQKLDINGKLDLFSRPPAPGVFPGFPYPHDLARPLFSSTGSAHSAASPYGPSSHPAGFLPTSHLADPFSRSSSFGGLGNLSSSAFGGLGNPSLGSSSVFGHKEGAGLPGFGSPHHDAWNRLHRTPPSFPTPPQWPKSADPERSNSIGNYDREREREREKRDSSVGKEEREKERDSLDRNRSSNRSSPASAPVGYQISNLIRSSQNSSDSAGRQHGGSLDRAREMDKDMLERPRESAVSGDIRVKESRSPGKEVQDRRPSEESCKPTHRSPSPYQKNFSGEAGVKATNNSAALLKDEGRKEGELIHKAKNDMKIKEERKEDQEVVMVSSEPASLPPSVPPPISHLHHHHHPHLQQPPHPSPRGSELPAVAPLHGVPLPHSLPLPMSAVHQMGGLSVLDRARVAPFVGVSPLAARDRLPHPAFPWDPLREAYRSLDLQRRMDFQLRAEPGPRFPTGYEPERAYREREPHDYSHHEHLLEVRREQERLRLAEERERIHLRDELDRARLHQLHQSPMEGHLPHMPPFMPHLGGMHYPRLSPSAGHNGLLNRTPPTAALSAPPPLVPSSSGRPASPRRTTPLTTQDPRDYSPSRNPKEVEAR